MSARCDGTLPDTFENVDVLQLDVEVPCFNHIKIIPKSAMALWCECFTKALNSLSGAPTQDAASRLIIRRALIW
jgi:hypothetical protein